MAKHGGSRFHVIGVFSRLLATCLLLAGVNSCSSEDPVVMITDGPLVRLHLTPFDMSTTQATLSVTAKDAMDVEKQLMMNFTNAPLDVLGVSFPVGARGATSYQISLYGDAGCIIATGTGILNLDSDGVFDLTVTMTPVPLCGNGATLTVQVADVNGGSGRVTSTPAGIDCQGSGAGCSITVMQGMQYTLTAQPMVGTFAGWTGGGCMGSSPCTITLNADTQVQAVFTTCRGWCKEQLPFSVSANLNGVAGTDPGNVLVVGDSGTALHWDGTVWQQLTPPSGTNIALRAAGAKSGSNVITAAGEMGTILQLVDGANWQTITNGISTATLNGVAVGGGGLPNTYLVGANTNLHILSAAGAVTAKNVGATVTMNGVAQSPNTTGVEVYMVGAQNLTRGFAESWLGKNPVYTQMGLPNDSIAGDIFAMLCASNYYYAAGAGGAIVRRLAASGNDTIWKTVTSGTTSSLRGMWAGGNNNIYAVGDGGTIVTYDGNASGNWTRVASIPTTNNLRAIWGSSPTNIYAVGDGGVVLHYLP